MIDVVNAQSSMSMVKQEPVIKVGIIDRSAEVRGVFRGQFAINGIFTAGGEFQVRIEKGGLVLTNNDGKDFFLKTTVRCTAAEGATFTLRNVAIGRTFHWEQSQDQTFRGNLTFILRDNESITAINEIPLEEYLLSVVSSEMNSEAPLEFLKAHAVTSRSWLVAMLEREKKNIGSRFLARRHSEAEVIRWYEREDHDIFDVCADDHCQRYQGISKVVSPKATEAVEATRGVFLVHDGKICDARFSKSCGGITENFENVWEMTSVPYLTSVSDSPVALPPIRNETDAEKWILDSPPAYCNTSDISILRTILPSSDLETKDFFRWKMEYTQREIGEIINMKSGIDFGEILDLVPLQRGPSGRIIALKIHGSKRSIIVGKELEIRRWLSKTHLYSSAFILREDDIVNGVPQKFTLFGAGWGHGVGLCQIGAAVMAIKGFTAEEIVKHYFRSTIVQKLY